MITYAQKVTPVNLTGKVMALVSCIVMCANPMGQAVYGVLFERFSGKAYLIYFGAFIVCLILCWRSHRTFRTIDHRVMTE